MNNSDKHIRFDPHKESLLKFSEKLNASIDWQLDIINFIKEWTNDRPYISVNTSGSTGIPKSIKLKKNHVKTSAKITNEYFKLNQSSHAYNPLPLNFIAGKLMLVRALIGRYSLDFTAPSSQIKPLEDVTYDFCPMTPFQVANSLESLHVFKTIIIGGGRLSDELKSKLFKLDTQFYETFGMTETITHIAVKDISESEFHAIGQTRFWANNDGQLIIKAPHLGVKEILTNDVVDLIDTRKFKWLSRLDDVVNSGGIKLFPEQIEKKISPWMDRSFFFTKQDDSKLGEKLIMVIEGKPLDSVLLKLLKSELKETLTKHEVPKDIIFMDQFEYTANGKLIRRLS